MLKVATMFHAMGSLISNQLRFKLLKPEPVAKLLKSHQEGIVHIYLDQV